MLYYFVGNSDTRFARYTCYQRSEGEVLEKEKQYLIAL